MATMDLKTLLRKRKVSSLELVELLNDLRADGEARLRYDHLVRKLVKVLGDAESKRFIVEPPIGPDRARTIYEFPRREACLLVLSYGYRLQAMLLDLILPRSKRN
jgi:elongation factor P--beta-lysine ligase